MCADGISQPAFTHSGSSCRHMVRMGLIINYDNVNGWRLDPAGCAFEKCVCVCVNTGKLRLRKSSSVLVCYLFVVFFLFALL